MVRQAGGDPGFGGEAGEGGDPGFGGEAGEGGDPGFGGEAGGGDPGFGGEAGDGGDGGGIGRELLAGEPNAPENVNAEVTREGEVLVTWSVTGGPVEYFELQRRKITEGGGPNGATVEKLAAI